MVDVKKFNQHLINYSQGMLDYLTEYKPLGEKSVSNIDTTVLRNLCDTIIALGREAGYNMDEGMSKEEFEERYRQWNGTIL